MSGLAEPLLNRGGEYKMAQAFSQLTVNTRKSPLTLERMGGRGLCAGDRALDADVVQGTKSVRLYDTLYAGGWTLLAFTGVQPGDAGVALNAALALGRPDLPCYLVSTVAGVPSGFSVLYDLDQAAHRAYGVVKPSLYLVRPDGHVGARVPPHEAERLRGYLETWLPSSGPGLMPGTPFHVKPLWSNA